MKEDDKQNINEPEIIYEETPESEVGDDALSDTNAMNEKLAKLKEKLKECESQKTEYLSGWQRAKADLVNAGKRHEEERRRFSDIGEENVLVEMLPALDAFDMAMGNKEAWEKIDTTWRHGVEYIRSQIINVFSKFGVEPYGTVNDDFDANKHHSIETVSTKEPAQDNKLAFIVQKGYSKGGQVMRPAVVKVFHLEQ